MFDPITTARLVIAEMPVHEGELLWRRRNDPAVAEYQNWTLPFPRDRAERMVTEIRDMGGPRNGEWWMASITPIGEDAGVGDLSLHLDEDGCTAEIGYTLDHSAWGNGYAVEAADALIEYLFETLDVTRVFGMLHPDNPASAQVLERTGFLFEGHTRSSFRLGDEVSDDHIYGMVRSDWEAWRDRTRTPPDDVRLVEVTRDNLWDVLELATHKSQERFVAPMGVSLAEALIPEEHDGHPLTPWYRAIEADGEIAGFVMLALSTEHLPRPLLWRLLIDRMHQRRGIGTRALEIIEDLLRAAGDHELDTSVGVGRGSPHRFYLSRGFQPTGLLVDGETELRKAL